MSHGSDPVSVLRRWEAAGGVWRVVARSAGSMTIALCQCTGGEEVERLTSSDPGLLGFVGDRASNEE